MQRFIVAFGIIAGLAACGPQAISSPAESSPALAALTADCDLSGTWAVRFEIPVSWPATLAVEAGHSTVYQWAKVQRTQQGTSVTDDLAICGVQVPDNVAREVFKHERYGINFPSALFDRDALPHTSYKATLQGSGIGANYTSDPVTVVLGLSLDNASTATWPLKSSEITPIDSDGDGLPGVTIEAAIGAGYSYPPVNMFRSKRAAKFYIAMRNAVQSATGQVVSCDRVQGTATIPVIAGKAAINSRVVGCQRSDGAECTGNEYELVDKLQSGYDLAGQATVIMQRVDAGTTCAQVRNATF